MFFAESYDENIKETLEHGLFSSIEYKSAIRFLKGEKS
jgi:hypothetical protein